MNRLEVFGTIAVQGALEVLLHIRAGIEAATARAATAQALIDFLRSPSASEVYRAKGLDPA